MATQAKWEQRGGDEKVCRNVKAKDVFEHRVGSRHEKSHGIQDYVIFPCPVPDSVDAPRQTATTPLRTRGSITPASLMTTEVHSDVHNDEVRFTLEVAELEEAIDISKRTKSPSWGYDWEERCWMWKKPPPLSKEKWATLGASGGEKKGRRPTKGAKNTSLRAELLEEFISLLYKKVLSLPVTTPCGHNFCKSCLKGNFASQSLTTKRTVGGRTLRTLKNVMDCPECSYDISDFLHNPQETD